MARVALVLSASFLPLLASAQQLPMPDFVPVTCVDTGVPVASNSDMCVTYYAASDSARQSLSGLSAYTLSYESLATGARSAPIVPTRIGSATISFLFRVPEQLVAGSYALRLGSPNNITLVPVTVFSVFSSKDLDGKWPLPDSIQILSVVRENFIQDQFQIYGRFPSGTDRLDAITRVFVIAKDGSMTYSDQANNTLAASDISTKISWIGVVREFPVDGIAVILIDHGRETRAATITKAFGTSTRSVPPMK